MCITKTEKAESEAQRSYTYRKIKQDNRDCRLTSGGGSRDVGLY